MDPRNREHKTGGTGDGKERRPGINMSTGNRKNQAPKHIAYIATAAAVVLVVVVSIILKNYADNRTYTTYEVERSEKKADSVSKYAYADGNVLRYSIDGAALIKSDLSTAWNEPYQMQDPRLDICDGHILIYDRLGTTMNIYNRKGLVTSFAADGPILSARISKKNTVAALLKSGDEVNFVYYSQEGTPIASGSSNLMDPGYPLALTVSDDGRNVAIACLTIADGVVGSALHFYDFSGSGKNNENSLTGEDSFRGILIPEIQYLNGDECVAFRDNGFSAYRGRKSQSLARSIDFDSEIVSSFHDGSHMGFIFRSEDRTHRFEMKIYTTNGNLVSSTYVDQPYTRVHVCGDWVIFSSASGFAVYSMNGVCRYSGNVQAGCVADVVRIGNDRLLTLTDYNMEVIRLK